MLKPHFHTKEAVRPIKKIFGTGRRQTSLVSWVYGLVDPIYIYYIYIYTCMFTWTKQAFFGSASETGPHGVRVGLMLLMKVEGHRTGNIWQQHEAKQRNINLLAYKWFAVQHVTLGVFHCRNFVQAKGNHTKFKQRERYYKHKLIQTVCSCAINNIIYIYIYTFPLLRQNFVWLTFGFLFVQKHPTGARQANLRPSRLLGAIGKTHRSSVT